MRIRFMATSYHFAIAVWRGKRAQSSNVKYYWEIIARNLKKRGWSLGYVSASDSNGRTIWIADAHGGDGAGPPMLNSARRHCTSPRIVFQARR
jgi:hypothetical protein